MTRNPDIEIEPLRWEKGYKLLNIYYFSHRRSLCVAGWSTRSVDYPVMVEVYPQPGAGPLTVFKTKADIMHFFTRNGWQNTAKIVRCIFLRHEDQDCGLWGTEDGKKRFTKLPQGTILASTVICLE